MRFDTHFDTTESMRKQNGVSGSVKAQTQQANIKELAVMKGDSCVASRRLRLGRQVAFEHTTKTTADGQLACTFCACARGNNSPHQQVAVVCIRHSKRETRRQRMAVDIQAVVMMRAWNKAALADHFHTTLTHRLASFQMAMSMWKYLCIGTIRWDEDKKWEEFSGFSTFRTLLVGLLSSLSFLFLCTDSFKLNGQSEWFLSLTSSAADSTCWIDMGRLEPRVRDTPQKLGQQTLTDGRRSAWCVGALK